MAAGRDVAGVLQLYGDPVSGRISCIFYCVLQIGSVGFAAFQIREICVKAFILFVRGKTAGYVNVIEKYLRFVIKRIIARFWLFVQNRKE